MLNLKDVFMTRDVARSHMRWFTMSGTRVGALVNMLGRLASMVRTCAPAILMLGMGILGIYALYTIRVVTAQQTPPQMMWDILFPPAARHTWMLLISLFAFILMFVMTTMKWNWQTRPIADFINTNAEVGFFKSVGIWFLIVILPSGLDIMLQPHAKVDAFELGVIVASCIVLYDVVIFWQMLRDVVKHMLFSLLFLVTIVNLFVTIPLAVPFRELVFVAVAAALIDFFASYGVTRILRRAKIQTGPAVSTTPSVPTPTAAITDEMMFCRECGKQIPRESKFCQFCGAQLV